MNQDTKVINRGGFEYNLKSKVIPSQSSILNQSTTPLGSTHPNYDNIFPS